MGLFSSKKKTYVSSVAYPLGEDDDDRVDYLKYTVLNASLQGRSVGESIKDGYLKGQGMSLRNAFKYARDHYAHGVPISAANYLDQPDTSVIVPLVQGKFPGAEILFLSTLVASADFEWWAEKFLTEEYGYDRTLKEFVRPPAGVEHDAVVAYDLEPGGLIRILLMNADGVTKVVDHRPTGYVSMGTFLHCSYQARTVFVELEETTTRPATEGEVSAVAVSETTIDQVGERQFRVERTETDVADGTATVRKLITVTVTTRPQYLLYRLGTGLLPTIDAWLDSEDLLSPYYPSIPLRVNNVDMLAESKQDTPLYKTSKKLLKRVGADLDKLGESVNTNPNVKDIDFAFITFGVALNTKSPEGKRYLFRYFEYLRDIGTGAPGGSPAATKADMEQWEQEYGAAGAGANTGEGGIAPMGMVSPMLVIGEPGGGGGDPNNDGSGGGYSPRMNAVRVYSQQDRKNNHDIKIQWNYIDTTLKSGVIFPGAKINDCEVVMGGTRTEYAMLNMDMVVDNSKLYLRRQLDVDTYEEMEVAGLVHENFIYEGKSTVVTAYDAFNDVDEEGFIVPLNQQIVRNTPLVELTNLAYQCMHMVFNCYQVVKQKWYQRGVFKVLLVILAVVLMVFFPPAGVTALAAVIGAGVVTLMTLVIAAAITVLAGMVLSNLLLKVAVQVFGEEWGPVIAALVMVVAMNWEGLTQAATTMATTGITASMVLQATMAGLNVYGAYVNGQMTAVQKKLAGLETEYDKQMKEIEELTKVNLDTNTDLIDIYGLTQATNLQFESADAFLGRTLITGSDVCDITAGLIENFVDVGLQLPNTG